MQAIEMQAARPNHSAGRVMVIGAGLAGACAARALAQVGWQVTVLDAAAAPAQGASALPVGLMTAKKGGKPQKPQADEPHWDGQGQACTRRWLEDLTRLGRLQQGQDWQICGSAESLDFRHDNPGKAPVSPPSWQWQADACWVKPARLVAACLAQEGIACAWQVRVERIAAQGAGWALQLGDGRSCYADALVLAASVDSARLLRALPPAPLRSPLRRFQLKHLLNPSAGQAIYAPWQPEWGRFLPTVQKPQGTQGTQETQGTAHACNGHGHFVPAVPSAAGDFWLSGATYVDSAHAQAADTLADEAANVQRLRELLPSFANTLAQQMAAGQLQRFIGVRCTTPTRLPMVQMLAPGLCLCTGFGSRGLSHAPLAAEYIAQKLLLKK